MACATDNFTITKGSDNTFVFTIKQNGNTLPMTIEDTDTFEAKLVPIAGGDPELTLDCTVTDANSGKIELLISSEDAEGLTSEKGSKADRYYIRPTYKLILDCSTVNNGDFIAKICEVYVD